MEEKFSTIKNWLGTGSINIFGLPMAGKDTQGIKLAEALNAKFLSSGMIVRAMEKKPNKTSPTKAISSPQISFMNGFCHILNVVICLSIPLYYHLSDVGLARKIKSCLLQKVLATKLKPQFY